MCIRRTSRTGYPAWKGRIDPGYGSHYNGTGFETRRVGTAPPPARRDGAVVGGEGSGMDPTQSLLQRIAITLEQIRIESLPLLQRIAIALEKRATPSESLGSTAGGPDVDVDRIVDQLVGRFDLQPRGPGAPLLNVSWLAGLIRRLGYPVTSVPPFVTGSYVDAWQDLTLDPVVRAVSVRLYARTAMPLPTPEQYRLRVRALDGTLADIDRVQQIWSPDGRSRSRGRPADLDQVTFLCWLWRRSKQLYQRKGAVPPGAWACFWMRSRVPSPN